MHVVDKLQRALMHIHAGEQRLEELIQKIHNGGGSQNKDLFDTVRMEIAIATKYLDLVCGEKESL